MAERILLQRHGARRPSVWDWRAWGEWVAANAAGEAIGLGATALIWLGLAGWLETTRGIAGSLAVAAGVVLGGMALEGGAVGTAQWLVLRRLIPGVSWRAWALATAAGAGVAWSLGMIPSTLAALGGDGAGAPMGELGDLATYGLAAALGFGLGPILGLPQWVVLRRVVRRAGWWIPANAVAWAAGMPIVFIGAGAMTTDWPMVGLAAVGLLTLAATGAVVGAIHGLALLWLAPPGCSASR
jgi:hypothetical protein